MKAQKFAYDRGLVVLTLILTFLGLVAIADISAPQAQNLFSDSFYYVKQQIVWVFIGLFIFFSASKIHYSFWRKLSPFIFWGSLVFLVLVLIPGIGSRFLGARRWIIIGPLTFQPSEFVKLSLAIYIASLSQSHKRPLSFIVPLILVGLLVMLQPDLGTTIGILGIALTQLFVAGFALLPFIGIIFAGGIMGTFLILISDYRRNRLLTYLKASSDPLGKSYHIRQIFLALGSGGFFGLGIGNSRQKYLFLPEAATDSLFAIVAEEVGFLGSTLLLILFFVMFYKLIKIAINAPDSFSKILSTGVAAWFGIQTFLNIGSMVAVIPLTGIPLPFFSYGGSSLVALLFALGIVLNISKYINRNDFSARKRR
ncbi:cell division protein FtsW [Candidatus Woesebacteria bacterium RIFCSPHIGHO2_02_FULL_38_9]|uniref:Probable peptidoglycan glycosyltransferase FtsW n=1 Tax=Candidatus Woesebacteria bacterium RIFCSPHIGHO2_01_FULL_39_28 TaxID=1802496 RepID=A0A1F7YC94_9BACT|nr:MAG: cell division protein FtsW [Candidatus Woesebacteria bacterium RIFCSPHIGHO2_01_FULL_39_28]OGM35294.1 MAG: cell division protein FtsW [Candidatus Woesebacteria bacterium RIFCSPHIGHO2_02_FULL_38_9]OGM58025.1 MAG: cell division protein FtsW [Candidatus Woesebacteria bacterium RIFCSPLOWO2_01_FULL_38_20]